MYENEMAMQAKQSRQGASMAGGQIGAASGYGNDLAKRDRGQIEISLDVNSSALDELEHSIAQLTEQAAVLLRPDPPQPVNAATEACMQGGPPCSPLAHMLQMHRSRIHTLVQRVNRLWDRLEV